MRKQEQISSRYFDQVPELIQISAPFPFSQISQQIESRDLETEFQLMRAITETKKHKMALRSNSVYENKKNRYPEQSIYEHSRVHLGQDQKNDYINANSYSFETHNTESQQNVQVIISQAPIQQTTDDFTQMIIQNRIQCIVMLCNYVENGKARCYEYLKGPSWREISFEESDQVEKRQIQINMNNKNIKICHLLYKGWPDKNVPSETQVLLPILRESLKYERVLVHCSAGLGRSGVFVAILEICQTLKNLNNKLSIFETVRRIREQRYGAIQNSQQYKFIYEFLKNYRIQSCPQ